MVRPGVLSLCAPRRTIQGTLRLGFLIYNRRLKTCLKFVPTIIYLSQARSWRKHTLIHLRYLLYIRSKIGIPHSEISITPADSCQGKRPLRPLWDSSKPNPLVRVLYCLFRYALGAMRHASIHGLATPIYETPGLNLFIDLGVLAEECLAIWPFLVF
jgi:hypothetical protein